MYWFGILLLTFAPLSCGGREWETNWKNEVYCKCVSHKGHGVNLNELTGGIFGRARHPEITFKHWRRIFGPNGRPRWILKDWSEMPGNPLIPPWFRHKHGEMSWNPLIPPWFRHKHGEMPWNPLIPPWFRYKHGEMPWNPLIPPWFRHKHGGLPGIPGVIDEYFGLPGIPGADELNGYDGLPIMPGADELNGYNGLPIMPGADELSGIHNGIVGPGGYNNGGGVRDVTSSGREFMTTFLQNDISDETPQRHIVVTAALSSAKVSVTLCSTDFKTEVTVEKGKTAVIPIPVKYELKGTRRSKHSLKITSDADITVMSQNYKSSGGDMALVYPVKRLGQEYYIITPPNGPTGQYNEFSVVSYESETEVVIYIKGSVTKGRKKYSTGDKMTLKLLPFETFQIQSKDNLSGTKVEANQKIVVVAGHTCATNNIGCGHVYEQLNPTESWGISFMIPGMSFQANYDNVLIMTSQSTSITYPTETDNSVTKEMAAGELLILNLAASLPLHIQSSNPIQVLLHGLGGTHNGRPFGSFFARMADTSSFGTGFYLIGEQNFDTNLAVIIAKTSSVPGIQLDYKSPSDIVWKNLPGSEYSWAEYDFSSGFSTHTIEHPTDPFGVLIIGYTLNLAYGSLAPCFQGTSHLWRTGGWKLVYHTGPTHIEWNSTSGLPGGGWPQGSGQWSMQGSVNGKKMEPELLQKLLSGQTGEGLVQHVVHAGGNVLEGLGNAVTGVVGALTGGATTGSHAGANLATGLGNAVTGLFGAATGGATTGSNYGGGGRTTMHTGYEHRNGILPGLFKRDLSSQTGIGISGSSSASLQQPKKKSKTSKH